MIIVGLSPFALFFILFGISWALADRETRQGRWQLQWEREQAKQAAAEFARLQQRFPEPQVQRVHDIIVEAGQAHRHFFDDEDGQAARRAAITSIAAELGCTERAVDRITWLTGWKPQSIESVERAIHQASRLYYFASRP